MLLNSHQMSVYSTLSPGNVQLKQGLPSPLPYGYQLTVTAKDGQNMAALVPATVTINVVGDSTVAPIFTNALYQFAVDENTAQNEEVDRIQATVQGWQTSV